MQPTTPTQIQDEQQPTITITPGQLRMASVAAGAAMMLSGVAGLIAFVILEGDLDDLRATITAALVALVCAGLSVLLYGAIAAHVTVMRHQADLRNGIEDAADARQRRTDEQLTEIRDQLERQARIMGEFFDYLSDLARQHGDELGHRRERRQG